jgi:hypothetical protein
MTLAETLLDEDYRFRLRFEQQPPATFFQPTSNHNEIIRQRRHWLETTPHCCAIVLNEGEPLLHETISFAAAIGTLPLDFEGATANFSTEDQELPKLKLLSKCISLGQTWEPDFLLLKPDDAGHFRLVAACVCFPTFWSLEEKIGHPIEEIHGVVPGLNPAIGTQIHLFLSKLRPGKAWLRTNWGMTRSPEFNQHPSRKLPRLDATVNMDEVWLRVEHQALLSLPETRSVLFAIRITMHPSKELASDQALAARLARALRTMPEPIAAYKGLSTARNRLLALLVGN